ncbi:hypothetical protein M9H77_30647 [Catharanthus roseus]|uniref:Uncharacterized protein n=1 Tax=Catharanthus roseus TaxID=4058 RepID=A0ACB9ZYW6_CATRO|nr:hypothetical protein M9H77_30647 [Catharanthus roseus]
MPNGYHEQDLTLEVGQPTTNDRCIGNKRNKDRTLPPTVGSRHKREEEDRDLPVTTKYRNNSRVVEPCPFLKRYDTRVVVLVYAPVEKGGTSTISSRTGTYGTGCLPRLWRTKSNASGVRNVEAISAMEARMTAMIEQKMGNFTTRTSNKPNQIVMFCDFCNRKSTESSATSQGKSGRVDGEVYEYDRQQNEHHRSRPKKSGSLHRN